MSHYPLMDLMIVRKHRVDRAAEAVSACKRDVARAEELLQKAKEAVQAYRRCRIEKETALYKSIMGKPILMRKLEEVKEDVRLMKQEELEREHQVLEAVRAVELANEQLTLAIDRQVKAIRAESKLFEHKTIWNHEQLRMVQLKEDMEVEDLPFRKITLN